jgi:7-cyano-7-deazaguanine synthase
MANPTRGLLSRLQERRDSKMVDEAAVSGRAVVLLSGGLDSTVLTYQLRDMGCEVKALSVNYKQRHCKELSAAVAVARAADVQHIVADLSAIAPLLAGSALTSPEIDVPLGHYEDASMKITVVPNRNMLLLSLATSWAITTKSDFVAYAAHNGDHAIYPDCRAEFAEAMEAAISLCDWHNIRLHRPFVSLSKADIVRRGADLDVPFHLTWSCYIGGPAHCGRCGTCIERREAFLLAGVSDPTVYSG